MGVLKDDLKAATKLLKDGNYEQVLDLLKEYIDDNREDYMLFSYVGLANEKIKNYDESYKAFKKAIKLDPTKPIAWKGVFKLFENGTTVKPDQFTIEICKKIIELSDAPDKKLEAQKVKFNILLELEDWKEILNIWNEEQNIFNFSKIINIILENKLENVDINKQQVLEKSFNELKNQNIIEKDENIFEKYCFYLESKSDETLLKNLEKLIELFPSKISEKWIKSRLFTARCEDFFINNSNLSLLETISENLIECEETQQIVLNLKKQDSTSAIEILDSLDLSSKIKYPDSLIFFKLVVETENWTECEEIIQSIKKSTKNPIIQDVADGWLVRIGLFDDQDLSKFQAANIRRPLIIPEFLYEELTLLAHFEPTKIDEFLKQFPETSIDRIFAKLVLAKISGEINEEHTKMAKTILDSEEASITWNRILFIAEIYHSAGIDATALLVKAAKLNPRSSRVFFVLGKTLINKNLAKAVTCLKRAVKIQPGKEEYVKTLDEALVQQEATKIDRLANLKHLAKLKIGQRKSKWLTETISLLYLETEHLDEAIEELQHLVRLDSDNKLAWARLAQAYLKKGHLRAAVSSYEHLAQLENGHEYTIMTIRVYLQLREFEKALEIIEKYREDRKDLKNRENSNLALNILEIQVRLNLLNSTFGLERRNQIRCCLKLLEKCIKNDESNKFSIIFKLAGDVLLEISEYHQRFFEFFEIDPAWKITDQLSCLEQSIAYYSLVVQIRPTDSLGWQDLAASLIRSFAIDKNEEKIKKAEIFIKHALKLTKDENLLSNLWALFAETQRLLKEHPTRQLHCLTRSIQLNKTNDMAWLQLGILCLNCDEVTTSNRAFEQAIKYNPHNADAWCAWALHAHLQQAEYDAMMMFRQALCQKPTVSSVVGYCSYLCDSIKKAGKRFDSTTAALEFEPVVDLREKANCDEKTLYHLGILSDLFGYYKEAVECFELAKMSGDEVETVKMKLNVISPNDSIQLSSSLSPNCTKIASLLLHNKHEIMKLLKTKIQLYNQLFESIENEEVKQFREIYVENVKNISVPLFVSAILALDINVPIECVATIHEALPRHELIDYFPTILPDGMDNGLRHLENDGEAPFRYKHHVAKELLDELKVLREIYEAENLENVVEIETTMCQLHYASLSDL